MEKEIREVEDLVSVKIHAEKWLPKGKAKACMILVHGLGEHCNRYTGDFADFYLNKGVIIYTFDLPGHGRSEGKRGSLGSLEDFGKIINETIDRVKAENQGLPVFIYGHSLGGLIVLEHAVNHVPDVTGVIASAPVLDVFQPVPAFKKFLARALKNIIPTFTMHSGLIVEVLSKDKVVLDAYVSDPLVHTRISAMLGAYTIDVGAEVQEKYKSLTMPTLLVVGSKEANISIDAIKEFAVKTEKSELKIFDGLFHEIHNEPEKQDVFKYTWQWMGKQMS